MTQFADITVTDEQVQAINNRIAAGREYAEHFGDINEDRNEPTGEEAYTMTPDTETPFETEEEAHAEYYRLHPQDEGAYTMTTTTQTPADERRLTLGLKPHLTKKEQKEYDQLTAAHDLMRFVQPGDTVYVSQRHVSRSGMKRILTLHVIAPNHNGKPALRDITWTAATAMQWSMSPSGQPWGIVVNGCGMDMHFHTVYTLASALFDDGYALTHNTL